MSSLSSRKAWRQFEHIYFPDQLMEMAGGCTVPVGGLLINIADLAKLGWKCKLVDSHHGSRIKLTFFGPDGKSIISFRAAPSFQGLSFQALCYALTDGVVTALPQLIKNVTPDLELLQFVEANIRRRVRRQAKPRKEAALSLDYCFKRLSAMGGDNAA